MPRNRTNPLAPAIERLLVLTKLPRMEELADRFGFPIETVRSWNKRGDVSKPGLRRIAEALGVPVGNLQEQLVGEVHLSIADFEDSGAPMHLESRPASYTVASRGSGDESAPAMLRCPSDGGEARFQVVPKFSVRASAGNGGGEVDEEEIGEVAFEVNWMRRHLGRSGRGFASIEVRGDSMQPTLINGDEIIIDKHVHRVDVNGIYVIALRGDLLVKRVQRMLDGSLVVKSDNPAYEPETITADRAEVFQVVGRMVWPRVR